MSLGRLTRTSPLLALPTVQLMPPCWPAHAVCNLVQRRPQLAPLLAAVGCGEALPCGVAHTWGARVSRCAPLPLLSARPSRLFEQNQQCSSLATSLSSSLRSDSETLTCCPRKTARQAGDWLRRRFHRS